jgi:hypothetical protein
MYNKIRWHIVLGKPIYRNLEILYIPLLTYLLILKSKDIIYYGSE